LADRRQFGGGVCGKRDVYLVKTNFAGNEPCGGGRLSGKRDDRRAHAADGVAGLKPGKGCSNVWADQKA
jgi:hypothetical protein